MMPSSFITPQQLETVQRTLGGDLCRALELLTSKLSYEFTSPKTRQNGSIRTYAELREAKSLLSYLKYPDPTTPVRKDEMAWALGLVTGSYRAAGQHICAALLDDAARILGIVSERVQPIPADLDRKIRNEVRLTAGAEADAPLAVAV